MWGSGIEIDLLYGHAIRLHGAPLCIGLSTVSYSCLHDVSRAYLQSVTVFGNTLSQDLATRDLLTFVQQLFTLHFRNDVLKNDHSNAAAYVHICVYTYTRQLGQ